MENRIILSRLFSYVRPHLTKFVAAIISMAVVAMTEPSVAAIMEPMIDGTFIKRDPDAIVLVPLVLVGLFFIRGVARVVATLCITSVATRVVMQIRLDLHNHIQQLPQQFMDANPTGKLLSKVSYDVEQLSSTASHVWLVLVRDTLTVIGLLGYMFYQSWQLSLLVLVTVPIIAVIIKLVSTKMRKSSHALQQGMGSLTHRLEEGIKGHKLIKLYGAEKQESEKFHKVVDDLRHNALKLTVIGASNSPIVQFVIAIALAAVVYFAANLQGDASMSAGAFTSFFFAMGMLFAPLRALTNIAEPFQKGMAAAESVFSLLDESQERNTGTKEITGFTGAVEIRNVGFRYSNQKAPALNDINLSIRPGEKVALVGASGSGKTTLTQLLPRFYDPQQGQILFDGVDIRELSLNNLRDQIAYVDQEVLLFDETVAENIAFGDPSGPDPEKVRIALKHAHAEKFVAEMERGIESRIGEQGSMLSGGQRQRLALARAFYRQASLLILDEATSALDNESERQVQAALEDICVDRTTIIIAHRLSTIENADRIVVMDQGEIREIGTHRELMEKDGFYRGLYQKMGV